MDITFQKDDAPANVYGQVRRYLDEEYADRIASSFMGLNTIRSLVFYFNINYSTGNV